MDNRNQCPICRTPGAQQASAGANTLEFHCPRCGKFQIQTFAETQLRNSPPAFPPMHLLSGLCRNTWDLFGEKALITVDMFKSWTEFDKGAKIAIPRDTDPHLKGEYLLRYMRRHVKGFSDVCAFTPNELATAFCANKAELLFCLRYLQEKGYVEEEGNRKGQPNGSLVYRFTPAGWAHMEETEPAARQRTAVVVCPAGEGDALWTKGFSAGVQAAGIKGVCVDSRAISAKVSNDLIVAIRQSDALVADLSDPAPVALFEAGLACGLGKPVYWTCREDAANDKRLAVDAREFVITRWSPDHLDDFARRLGLRVAARG